MFAGLKMWVFKKLLNDIPQINHYTHEGKTVYHHKDFTLTVTGQKSVFRYIQTPQGDAHTPQGVGVHSEDGELIDCRCQGEGCWFCNDTGLITNPKLCDKKGVVCQYHIDNSCYLHEDMMCDKPDKLSDHEPVTIDRRGS